MREESDEALMAAYARGEEAAFDELFRRYAAILERMFLKSRCPGDLAKDLVQQTFLQLHRARNDFDRGRPFRPWLFTIGMNLVRGHYRSRARRPEEALDLDGRSDPRQEAVGAARIEDDERTVRVRKALDQLPEAQRVVIEMHWFEERSFKEIAEKVGANLSAVKVRAHRGYRKLEQILGAMEEAT
jgi:RNA polymerase sigma-70 factor (ECF subfamily)